MCSKNRLCLKQVTAFYVKKKKFFQNLKENGKMCGKNWWLLEKIAVAYVKNVFIKKKRNKTRGCLFKTSGHVFYQNFYIKDI